MKYLQIVNLDKYQKKSQKEKHWIKWYFKCLTDFRFLQLTDSERWLFIGLVLLSVQSTSNLPFNYLWIYQTLSKRTPKGRLLVEQGVKKMLKIGLISLCDSPNFVPREEREKNKKKNKRNDVIFKSNETTERPQSLAAQQIKREFALKSKKAEAAGMPAR